MKSFATVAALVSLVPTVWSLTLNTPTNVVECEPVQFTWADGTPPYFLSLLPAGQPSGTPLEQFASTTGTEYTWVANMQGGSTFSGALKDSTGATVYTSIVTVLAGTDSSCLTSGGSSAAPAPGSPSTPAAPGSTPTPTSAGASPPASSPAGASSPASKPASSASGSAATTKASSAASRDSSVGAFGVAGVMGLVGALLF